MGHPGPTFGNSDANSTPRGRDLDDRHPRNSRGQWCEYINSRSVPFRFEVEQTRSRRGNLAVEGYVYNSLLWPVGRVRLRIDILDQNGMVIDTTYGWVGRDVPAGGRAYFVVPIAVEGAAYRVTVASFDTLGGGGA